MGRIIKAGEAAGLLGTNPKTLNNWARTGRIKAFRLDGDKWRFDEDHVREFAAALEMVGLKPPGEPEKEDHVNVFEASKLLGVAKPTVYLWIKEGKLKAE